MDGEAEDYEIRNEPILTVAFYRTEAGNESVRIWLKSLKKEDRRAIGEDIKTAQFGWPIGMPLIRKIERDLWEVRSSVKDGVARVFFPVEEQTMILLHGFIKKSQKTPKADLNLAKRRLADFQTE